MKGYIKLYRQIIDNPIWNLKPFSEGQAWIDLLCITNYENGFIKTKNGQVIKLTCGQCGYSILTLSEKWGWSRGKVKRFLKLLEEQQMIQQKICSKHTIINILNFEKYQKRTTNDTTNDTTNGQQMIQQTDTIKNDKNDNNDKKERIINPLSQNSKILNFDLMYDENVNKVFSFYEANCKNLVPLKFEKRDIELRQAISDFLIFIDFDFSYFFDLCQKANEQVYLLDNKIDLKSLIKNHSRIYSGFFEKAKKHKKNDDEELEKILQDVRNGK